MFIYSLKVQILKFVKATYLDTKVFFNLLLKISWLHITKSVSY